MYQATTIIPANDERLITKRHGPCPPEDPGERYKESDIGPTSVNYVKDLSVPNSNNGRYQQRQLSDLAERNLESPDRQLPEDNHRHLAGHGLTERWE